MVPTITLDPYSIEISSELTTLARVNFAPPPRATELRWVGRAEEVVHFGECLACALVERGIGAGCALVAGRGGVAVGLHRWLSSCGPAHRHTARGRARQVGSQGSVRVHAGRWPTRVRFRGRAVRRGSGGLDTIWCFPQVWVLLSPWAEDDGELRAGNLSRSLDV